MSSPQGARKLIPYSVPWMERPEDVDTARVDKSHPLARGLIGLWILGSGDPETVINALDGVVSGLYDPTNVMTNVVTSKGRALDAVINDGFVVRATDYTFTDGFSMAASADLDTSLDQLFFMVNGVSSLSMWADNFGGGLRIAAQPSISYGSTGELNGQRSFAVTYESGVEKKHYIDGVHTATEGHAVTPTGVNQTVVILGAQTSKQTRDPVRYIALWDRPLTEEEGKFVSANHTNIYSLLEPVEYLLPAYAEVEQELTLLENRVPWTEKPDFGGVLSIAHEFYPNKLCVLFNGPPMNTVNLSNGKVLAVTEAIDDLVSTPSAEGILLSVAHSASSEAGFIVAPALNFTTGIPWEITFRAKKGTTQADWAMVCGTRASNNNWIGFNESGGSLRFRNTFGNDTNFTALPSFESEIKTYTITSDGGGASSVNLRLYVDGVLHQNKGGVDASFDLDGLFDAYAGSDGYSFEGEISHLRASIGKLYSADDVKKLHANLYQVLDPRIDLIPHTVNEGPKNLIEVKIPWTEKPDVAALVDWSNLIAEGLVAAYILNETGTSIRDLVTGQTVSIESLATPVITGQGRELKFDSSDGVLLPSSFDLGHSGFCIIGNITHRTTSGDAALCGSGENVGSPMMQFWRDEFSPDRYGLAVMKGTAGYSLMYGTTNPGSGTPHTLCASSTARIGVAGKNELYVNGYREALGTGDLLSTFDEITIRIGGIGQGAKTLDGSVKYLFIFDQYKNSEQVGSLTDNPWQILEPRTEFIQTDAIIAAIIGGSIVLTVQSVLHAHLVDVVGLTQANALAVDGATHGHLVDAPVLSVSSTLAVSESLHAHAAESLTLTQSNLLTVAESLHAHVVDSVALSQANVLAVQEVLHGHLVDNVVLATAGILSISDVLHAHQVDSVALTQANILAVSSASHAHAVDSPALSLSIAITPASTVHAHSVESPAITVAHVLSVLDSIHAHSVEAVDLVQSGVLIVSDALHAHIVDNLALFSGVITTPDGRVFVVKGESRVFVIVAENRTLVCH